MKKLLVLGAGGFIGKRFIDAFDGRYDITAVISDADGKNPDLANYHEMAPILGESRPEAVLNLAGKSYHSTDDDAGIYESNALVQLNLHEAICRLAINPKVVLCSSGAVYEGSTEPIDESGPCLPITSYAKAKYMQERIALSYHPAQHVTVARLFNVIGPFQNENFFVPKLIRSVLRFKNNEIPEVSLKTLNAMRDFIYIDDICKALGVLIEKGSAGMIYNVCRGEGVSIEEVVELAKTLLNAPELPVKTEEDHVKGGITYQVGSCSRLQALGWSPEYGIEESLKRIVGEEYGY
jgi:GDP-4-dehydro-6-deoxy-D-mannose reductase